MIKSRLTGASRQFMLEALSHYTGNKMNTLEILKAGRAKITNEGSWCQNMFAKDGSGEEVFSACNTACSWCSEGALKSTPWDSYNEYENAFMALHNAMGSISRYNDSHTHSEVLSKWDEAIADAEKEAK